MKIARIDAEFEELKGDNRLQGYGEGSTIRAAISRAVSDIFGSEKLNRKRITSVNMTVKLSNKTATEEVEKDA
jgi:hypothetical protein